MAATSTNISSTPDRRGRAGSGDAGDAIRRIALVSHDYNVPDTRGFYDYSEHFARINRLCDEQGCDTILYALYTWDRISPTPRDPRTCFADLVHVRSVFLEVGSPEEETFDHVEIIQRGNPEPFIVRQCFAASGDPSWGKEAFIADLENRKFGDSLLMLCGESNIVSTMRGTKELRDPFGFIELLREMDIRLILNPIHDYMRRYEMRVKRREYSLGGVTVLSVWNRGKGRESETPWTAFRDGKECTASVHELAPPFPGRPDIRLGILDVD